MDNCSASLGESLPKNVNSQNVCGVIEAAQNLQPSCDWESAKDMEESKPCELPPEMWIHIFKYLSQYELFKTIRLVCPKWRKIVDDAMGANWQIIELKGKDIKQPFLVYLSQRSDNIQSLTLSGSTVSCTGLILALKQMPSLKELALDYCNCLTCCGCNCLTCCGDQKCSFTIICSSQNLCSVINYTVKTPYKLVVNGGASSWTLASIGQHCPQLTHLDLTGHQKLTDDALKAIVCGCKHLTHLCLMACRPFTSLGINAIADNCASLRELNLDYVEYSVIDTDLERLANGCPKLQSLSLCRLENKERIYDMFVIESRKSTSFI